jgi:hypothetical protein
MRLHPRHIRIGFRQIALIVAALPAVAGAAGLVNWFLGSAPTLGGPWAVTLLLTGVAIYCLIVWIGRAVAALVNRPKNSN